MSTAINLAAAMAVGSCCTRSLHAARPGQSSARCKRQEQEQEELLLLLCWYCLLARLVQLMRLAGWLDVAALSVAVVVCYQQVLNFNLQFIAY